VQEFPANKRQVFAERNSLQETEWPFFREAIGQPLKNSVFQPCKRLWNAKLCLVSGMFGAVNCAADCAATPILPIGSLDNFICIFVRRHTVKVFLAYGIVVVECE
jgi:hypothetical protein